MGPIVSIRTWVEPDEAQVAFFEVPAQVMDNITVLLARADELDTKDKAEAQRLRDEAKSLTLEHGTEWMPERTITTVGF